MPRLRMPHRPAISSGALLLLAILLQLGGCGFQPRGQAADLSGVPSPLHISGLRPFAPLNRELQRQLQLAGVTHASDAAGSAATLRVSRHTSNARVLSVDASNKAVEYELEESVRFTLLGGDGRPLTEEQTVRVLRVQFRPRETILGSEREGELLREDMRRELAGRLLQRLAAQR